MSYLVGLVLALGVGAMARRSRFDRDRAFYPTLLIVIASYYLPFAAMAGSARAAISETAVMLAFLLIAAAGFRRNLWSIVAALAAHGVLDWFHDGLIVNAGVPAWWPGFCLAFDVAAACVLAFALFTRVIQPTLFITGRTNAQLS